MEDSPADTGGEEIERLIKFCRMKAVELLDKEKRHARPGKASSMNTLASVLRNEKLEEFKHREDVENVLEELKDWCESNVELTDPEYSIEEMSCFIELLREINLRLMNYNNKISDVTLEVREEWEEKYGQDN